MYSKMLRLRFPKALADKPIVCNLVKDYDLTFNIFQAAIYPRQEGVMVMELSGHRKNYQAGVAYLKEMGVKVETHWPGRSPGRTKSASNCGLCTAICPTGALSIKRPEMEVEFDPEVCSACELCVSVCPPRAMKVSFNSEKAL